MNTTQQPASRPTSKSTELIEKLLHGLSRGRSIATLCEPSSMPLWSTVLNWLSTDEQLVQSFDLASEIGRAFLADRLIDIADEAAPLPEDEDGSLNEVSVRWAKLRVDTRLKILSKWKPMNFSQMASLLNPDGGRKPAIKPSHHHSRVNLEPSYASSHA